MTNTSKSAPAIVAVTAGDTRPAVDIDSLLDDRGQSKTLRRTLAGIILLTVVALVWASVAQVDELARARGEMQPGGHVQVLQSETGGTIIALHVNEGDRVTAGQMIADFATTDIDKMRAQTDVKLAALAIDRERMQAVLENRLPNFGGYSDRFPMLVEQGLRTYHDQITARDKALEATSSQGAQQGAMLQGAERERQLIAQEIREARDRLARLEEGARRGVITQLALSDARQQLTALQERLSEATARAQGMRSSIGGVDAEMARQRADYNEQLSNELSAITEQYSELLAERRALEETEGRIQLEAPVDGIVTALPQTAEGAVIPPGGIVAEVVPTGQDVVMEVMVMPRDIGFVKEGQRAVVKVDSFDSARFGSVEGRVQRVAPTSSKLEENGMPYYKVEVALSSPYVGGANHRLMPGMTGEADIATGRKSVIQYLLKPIFLASDTAFHER
ncbi:HlyD family type I secretion periplasmic adaptor subunit [Marinobacterium sp. YM272]|uniref:HlyD family type I secretion periplasmic adaptor subunit n=1 Tax=Marinobacterium sp. YM272 TaxID=3421654 RepID=UPI003D7FFCD5